MRRKAGRGELSHQIRVDLVVGLALLRKLRDLDAVERRHVVAVMHDEVMRIVGCIDGLRFSLVELLPPFHGFSPASRHVRLISLYFAVTSRASRIR
jgi:hypothetical protein